MDRNNKQSKPWYKRVWVWIGIIVLLGIAGGAVGGNKGTPSANTGTTDTTSTTQTESPEEAKPAKWDIEAAYAKVNNGMTKAEVEAATGKSSDTCTVNEDPTFGKTEYCSYGNAFIDKGTISVTYRQDLVESKTKSTY